MYDLCIKNGVIITPNKVFEGAILVNGGRITELLEDSPTLPLAKETIDAEGRYIFPGAIDPHVHLNDPGLTESEDFYTGTCSAAAGGITTVLEHPLTDPLPATYKTLKEKLNEVKPKAIVDFGLWGACTPDNFKDVVEMAELGAVAFKGFLTWSPEIPSLSDGEIMEHMKTISKLNRILGIHCENQEIIDVFTKKLKESGRRDPVAYAESRPEISEREAVNRIALLAENTGVKAHIVHCSSPDAVEDTQRYKDLGAKVSVETCIQYLSLDINTLDEQGIYAVCNPPLRSSESVERMWKHILNDKIDCLGSDHATYTIAEKEAGLEDIFKTPPGVTCLQTWVPLLFSEGVVKRGLELSKFSELCSTNAAKIFGIYPRKGIISVGSDADIMIFDPETYWTISADELFYKQKWSPFIGMKVKGRVDMTIVRGKVVYESGKITGEKGYGEFIKPE
ncbi:allantoinase AllB [Wukongibacter baidiensis]|uniref:allantoinase AllB n=1 Tax=Wukongibacter baidiensis TaxID=1723361 RepID=UPI003D7FB66F